MGIEKLAVKIVKPAATFTTNYWSPLACLVEEQDDASNSDEQQQTNADLAMTVTSTIGPTNKVAAHWARKTHNKQRGKTGILDTGATSGAAPETDAECFVDTGESSTKIFMFPDKRTNKATKKMLTKHNLRESAREMNIVPGLHSTLISVPKFADADYTTVFTKTGAKIYDDYTTKITASEQPVLDAARCDDTGLWKLALHNNNEDQDTRPPEHDAINVIFDLPSARQSFLWYHAAAGFPTKDTFIRAVRNGNYATWPTLTVNLIHRHMPDSDETAKGHLKGRRKGIRSTKQNIFADLIEAEDVKIKIEGESSPFQPLPPTKLNDMFTTIVDLAEEIHTDQTGAFPHTSQRGNRYIMVAIHLDTNYIFAAPMKNRT